MFMRMCKAPFGVLVALALGAAACGDTFDSSWWTVDDGGGMFSTGGGWSVGGTIGQPDASPVLTGGNWSVTGGFWLAALPVLGDMNCDGLVNFDDINPFVTALVGQAAYEAAYPNCNWLNGDIDGDGHVTFDDINPFVDCLVNQGCP